MSGSQTLQISKLDELVSRFGLVPNKYYSLEGTCFLVEVICTTTGERFMIYIPSKYNFPVTKSHSAYVHPLKPIVVQPGEELNEDYKERGRVILPSSVDVEKTLEDSYKQSIVLADVMQEDAIELRSILRQVKRLVYSVANIRYKFVVVYRNFITIVRRGDNAIETYYAQEFPRGNRDRRLLVVSDLEILYEKGSMMNEEVTEVKKQITDILERNQSMHLKISEVVDRSKLVIDGIGKEFEKARNAYHDYINRLLNSLNVLAKAEREYTEKLNALVAKRGAHAVDPVSSKERDAYERELAEVLKLRDETLQTLVEVREKRNATVLMIDTGLYDVNLMVKKLEKALDVLKDAV